MRWKNIPDSNGRAELDFAYVEINFYFFWCCEGIGTEKQRKNNQFGEKTG